MITVNSPENLTLWVEDLCGDDYSESLSQGNNIINFNGCRKLYIENNCDKFFLTNITIYPYFNTKITRTSTSITIEGLTITGYTYKSIEINNVITNLNSSTFSETISNFISYPPSFSVKITIFEDGCPNCELTQAFELYKPVLEEFCLNWHNGPIPGPQQFTNNSNGNGLYTIQLNEITQLHFSKDALNCQDSNLNINNILCSAPTQYLVSNHSIGTNNYWYRWKINSIIGNNNNCPTNTYYTLNVTPMTGIPYNPDQYISFNNPIKFKITTNPNQT